MRADGCPGVLFDAHALSYFGLSLEVASPTDAREMLKLKGGDNVKF